MPSRDFCTLLHNSPNVYVVSEIDPEIMRTCSMCPCRAFHEWFFNFWFLSLEIWDPLRPKHKKKIQKTQISGKEKGKKGKTSCVTGSAGAH